MRLVCCDGRIDLLPAVRSVAVSRVFDVPASPAGPAQPQAMVLRDHAPAPLTPRRLSFHCNSPALVGAAASSAAAVSLTSFPGAEEYLMRTRVLEVMQSAVADAIVAQYPSACSRRATREPPRIRRSARGTAALSAGHWWQRVPGRPDPITRPGRVTFRGHITAASVAGAAVAA